MFARVISAQTALEGVDRAIRIAQEQLPSAWEQPGFSGCYLLADRTAGKLLTISLWQSHEDLRRRIMKRGRLAAVALGPIGAPSDAGSAGTGFGSYLAGSDIAAVESRAMLGVNVGATEV